MQCPGVPFLSMLRRERRFQCYHFDARSIGPPGATTDASCHDRFGYRQTGTRRTANGAAQKVHSTLAPTPYGQSESGLSAVSLRSRASSKMIEQPIVIRGDAKGRRDLRQRPSTDELPGAPVPLIRCETWNTMHLFRTVSVSQRCLGSTGIGLPQQLRQPRDVDGDPPRLVLRQHLGLERVAAGLKSDAVA